ncbi:glycosyltransferase [Candidatus Woesearchaeota archaeon]|nr:glycosyltransferase [Candidatus Woesearchaeota archaeon]
MKNTLSIIINSHDDFENVSRSLKRIFSSRLGVHEVILVDDASSDDTPTKIQYLFGGNPNLRIITLAKERGPHTCRNEGIMRATGDHLLFLDSNIELPIAALQRLLEENRYYDIVYPPISGNPDPVYRRFREAHEAYIKFSYCFMIKRECLYCFGSEWYDMSLRSYFSDFDFFTRAQGHGLSSFWVRGTDCRFHPPKKDRYFLDASGYDNDHALYCALYEEMDAFQSVSLICQKKGQRPFSVKTIITALRAKRHCISRRKYLERKREAYLDRYLSRYYRYLGQNPRPMCDAMAMMIEITNACAITCSCCTRGTGLIEEPSFMPLKEIEQALKSLKGWRRVVGVFGGEPTLHPQFAEICGLMKKYFPKEQRGLWTSGGKLYRTHERLIEDTFGVINYNDHKGRCYHQPVLVSGSELVKDKRLLDVLVSRCWLGQIWSPIITRQGAFYCEVAATLDLLYGTGKGFPVEEGWWKRDPSECKAQSDLFCYQCGICLPLDSVPGDSAHEVMSKGHMRALKARAEKAGRGVRLYDRRFTGLDLFSQAGPGSLKQHYAAEMNEHYWFKSNWLDTRDARRS